MNFPQELMLKVNFTVGDCSEAELLRMIENAFSIMTLCLLQAHRGTM